MRLHFPFIPKKVPVALRLTSPWQFNVVIVTKKKKTKQNKTKQNKKKNRIVQILCWFQIFAKNPMGNTILMFFFFFFFNSFFIPFFFISKDYERKWLRYYNISLQLYRPTGSFNSTSIFWIRSKHKNAHDTSRRSWVNIGGIMAKNCQKQAENNKNIVKVCSTLGGIGPYPLHPPGSMPLHDTSY